MSNQMMKFIQAQEIQKSSSVVGESFILIFRDFQALLNFLVYEQEVYESKQVDARVIGYELSEDRYLMLVHFCTAQSIPQGNPHTPSFYREVKQFKLGFSREITYIRQNCVVMYDPLHLIPMDHSMFCTYSPMFAQNIKTIQTQSDLYTIVGADRRVGQIVQHQPLNLPPIQKQRIGTRRNSIAKADMQNDNLQQQKIEQAVQQYMLQQQQQQSSGSTSKRQSKQVSVAQLDNMLVDEDFYTVDDTQQQVQRSTRLYSTEQQKVTQPTKGKGFRSFFKNQ